MPELKRNLIAHFKKDEKALKLRNELKAKAAFDDELMDKMKQEIAKVVLKMTTTIPDYDPLNYGTAESFKKLGK